MLAITGKGTCMRVLLIDDHSLFRRGLRLMLRELMPELDVSEVSSAEAALALADESFDLLMLDLNMPGVHGLDALAALKQAFVGSIVVVLSGEDNPALIRDTIAAGAAGFIPKSAEPEVMHSALRLVLAKGIYLPPQALSATTAVEQGPQLKGLSPRQLDVLRRALTGVPNKLIARELGISEGTVKSHLSAVFRVMNVRNRTEAVYSAARSGLQL